MKKVLIGLLLVSMVLAVISCGGGSKSVKFDPANREHLLEIYATTNYGTEAQKLDLIKKFDLNNNDGWTKYNEGITKIASTDDWTKFVEDAKTYLKK
ncbi:MAG: hypothetical protein PHV06_11475 [bacterium]|nr:hypothetical protein [bacterium]